MPGRWEIFCREGGKSFFILKKSEILQFIFIAWLCDWVVVKIVTPKMHNNFTP